jgi:hypothetical protein
LILKSLLIELIKLLNIVLLGANIAKSSTYKQIITLVVLFINKQASLFNTLKPSFSNFGFKV